MQQLMDIFHSTEISSVASSIDPPKKQTAFALDTLCPPGHESHCTPASGVYHDYDPETGRTFNINTGSL